MFQVPARLQAVCRTTPENFAWLSRLPDTLRELQQQWSLTLGEPFEDLTSCSWVAPVELADRTPAVLKLGMPHMEAEDEGEGLRFWNGDPTVRLLDLDNELGAILMERCQPGTALRTLPEREQDIVIAALLRRLWRAPTSPHSFRPLSVMTDHWTRETLVDAECWPDPGLVREGLSLFRDLNRTATTEKLLATDLHAGNVLQSQREPWLVIDPKPFLGDPAYDVTQHLFNCRPRLLSDPRGFIQRIADLAGVDAERVRLWAFARASAEPREDWSSESMLAIARAIGQ